MLREGIPSEMDENVVTITPEEDEAIKRVFDLLIKVDSVRIC
jgi:hypothetical protein